jgi:hypothetical protein
MCKLRIERIRIRLDERFAVSQFPRNPSNKIEVLHVRHESVGVVPRGQGAEGHSLSPRAKP